MDINEKDNTKVSGDKVKKKPDIKKLISGMDKKKTAIIGGGSVLALALLFCIVGITNGIKSNHAVKNLYADIAVVRQDIENTITGSSYIEPKDSYNVATIKSGDIKADYFKEGDKVKKGDKLYQFDDETARNSLSSAQNALTKAQQAYVDAVKQKTLTVSTNNYTTNTVRNGVSKAQNALNDAQRAYNDCYPKADFAGKVSKVHVKNGDNVSVGTPIANIYSDRYMKIRLPFNEFDAGAVYVGAGAQLNVVGSSDELWGSVTEVSSDSVVGNAHTKVVYATIELDNPGALSTRDIGSAVVNGVACSNTANFEYIYETNIIAKANGKIQDLSIADGDAVYNGQTLCHIDSDSVNTALSNARLSYNDAVMQLEKQVLANDTFAQDSNIKNAKLGLDDAKLAVKKAQDAVDDFLIDAPIDGTVVTKNAKSGDTIDLQNNPEPLCVIYDMSSLKFSISVDETEIDYVKVGQDVLVSADACEGEFKGKITKVPVDGTNQNGVTTYTVEVEITNYGELLPGMNCDAKIIVQKAHDVLSIPLTALNKGNVVFVKDNGKKRENDVTDIVTGKSDKPQKTKKATPASTKAPEETGDLQKNKKATTPKPKKADESDMSNLPTNLNVPSGYRAVLVVTGITDRQNIEIISGLSEGDMVCAPNRSSSDITTALGLDNK